jgi:2-dehydro-3-deoxygluconokinase
VELVSRAGVHPLIVLFGEGMIEERSDAAFAWGGDVVNTAVYLARQTEYLGVKPELMSAMGADAGSAAIVAAWASQGVGTGHVLRDPTRTAGRYKIMTGPDGERSFSYDRERSAARNFFAHAQADATLEWAARADILYLTGITLSIFGEAARGRICELAQRVRMRGGEVVFDTNYRPAGWPSPSAAWAAIEALGPAITLAMPSSDDHAALREPAPPAKVAADWLALGAREVVVKLGSEGAYVANADGESTAAPAAVPERIIDTTAAGDSFNAAYIAARLVEGASMADAARRGAALAAEVIGWPGAIAPPQVGSRAGERASQGTPEGASG